MHSDIAELLQRALRTYSCAFVPTSSLTICGYGCRRRQTLYWRRHSGLPFASCPGWETIKAAAILLAAVVAAEYKTNDHFVRRSSQIYNGGGNTKVTGSEAKARLQLSKRKIELFPLTRPMSGTQWAGKKQWLKWQCVVEDLRTRRQRRRQRDTAGVDRGGQWK